MSNISAIVRTITCPFRSRRKFVYVAMGDSTTEGVGASKPDKSFAALVFAALKREYKHVAYHNLGNNGAKVNDVVVNQLEKAIALRPDLVTLSVGTNDLRERTKSALFEKELSYLVEKLKMETDAKIMVNNIPDLSNIPAIPFILRLYCRILVKRFNKVIGNLTDKYQVVLVDLYKHTGMFTKRFPQMISADGLHPSDIGYALWATAIISNLSRNKNFN